MACYIDVVFNLPVNKIFVYNNPSPYRSPIGHRVEAPFGKRKQMGFVVGTRIVAPENLEEIKDVNRFIDEQPIFNLETLNLARWVAEMYMCSLGEALATILPGARREGKIEDSIDVNFFENDITLTNQQIQIVDTILRDRSGFYYLSGVTGSGKTAVALHVAKKIVESGKGVIYLVPEISLTHQMAESINALFPNKVIIYHSGLTASQRLKTWQTIAHTRSPVVLGARSAIFTPVNPLGLVVVDEEHETSYKSSATPRYNARQIAMWRCKRENALLIMGSATPSLEAYQSIKKGEIKKCTLTKRIGGGRLPTIEVVDMRRETGPLSKKLIIEIRETKSLGRQTILFLNRRGFAYFFHCKSCGYEMQCRNCSVTLTYHKTRNMMMCHYCGYRTAPSSVCPQCGSLEVGYSGFGTEMIEEEIKRVFPTLVIQRLDTDSVRKKSAVKKILTDFEKGAIDILLGTQMVAKGLNFPGVRLVGIVMADTSLHLPDFRSRERTFSLIVQVSGRAGRTTPDGRVVIQTFRPGDEAISLAARGSMEDFYNKELKIRNELRFPPFCRLIRIVIRGRKPDKMWLVANEFAEKIKMALDKNAEILGPAECPLSIIAGNHRAHFILRAQSIKRVHAVIQRELSVYRRSTGVYIEVDVDPVSLL